MACRSQVATSQSAGDGPGVRRTRQPSVSGKSRRIDACVSHVLVGADCSSSGLSRIPSAVSLARQERTRLAVLIGRSVFESLGRCLGGSGFYLGPALQDFDSRPTVKRRVLELIPEDLPVDILSTNRVCCALTLKSVASDLGCNVLVFHPRMRVRVSKSRS